MYGVLENQVKTLVKNCSHEIQTTCEPHCQLQLGVVYVIEAVKPPHFFFCMDYFMPIDHKITAQMYLVFYIHRILRDFK